MTCLKHLATFTGAALLMAARMSSALNFTISNGQIYTPGLVIVNAPQPGTPLGGDIIEVALDVSANGRLPLPPYAEDSPSVIHFIHIFLSSYDTGRNFTMTNGTASANNASLGEVMLQEPGSTVKHVKWAWPDCLVGDGSPQGGLGETDRGAYNPPTSPPSLQVSIRQSFRLNGQDYYTVFDLPISVTNSIPASDGRPSCDALDNPLLAPDEILASADALQVMFAPGDATTGSRLGCVGGFGCCVGHLKEPTGVVMPMQEQGQIEDVSSDEGSFASFGDDDALSGSDGDHVVEKRRAALDKDSDEEELERFVLGSKETFREHLFRDDFLPSVADSKALVKATADDDETTGHEHVSDSMLFTLDAGGDSDVELEPAATVQAGQDQAEEAPAWEDSDDERLTVSLAGATRLRKLRQTEAEDVVSGTEYARRLRQQYLRLYPLPDWAKDATTGSKRRRRRSSAASDASSALDMELDSDGESIDAPLPLDSFLRDASSFLPTAASEASRKRRKLRPETIDIQRTRDIPDTHKAAVSSLAFHPRRPILLSASTSSIMYLHHIDPSAHPTPNPALTSVQVKRTDLRRAVFAGGPEGDEVVFAGRRRYFHSWNLASGLVHKVSKMQGHQREQRTMERFRASPCGRYLAVAASDKKGGGMLNVVNAGSMQWIAQARVDGRGGVADFAWWRDGGGLVIAGKDGQVAEWSMATRRTVGIWRDEGSVGGTVMALGGRDGPPELGGDRWVAVGSNSGVLNVYDRNDLVIKQQQTKTKADVPGQAVVEIKKLPEPVRAFDQLTTSISVVAFSPDGQLMAFGSQHKKDALRLVHLPSCTVYRNWPTEQTPLGRITAVAFSAGSDVLAVGNDVGKIRLWEIRS
ncbi:WD40 repeat-like protein [Parathielavia hyrcaniae]|uniref:WD40 repeat-like protein n=1 Tax=Parathielavia hyrcaniae TaxID=113614 RepID=A0AAN6T5J0_9PEZI|nr:WD40 repeat-like protein [Parathielavia hyrcaniae]